MTQNVARQKRRDRGNLSGSEELELQEALANKFISLVASDLLCGPVAIDEDGFQVAQVVGVWGEFEQRSEPLLALSQRLVRAHVLGHVGEDVDGAHEGAVAIEERIGGDLKPAFADLQGGLLWAKGLLHAKHGTALNGLPCAVDKSATSLADDLIEGLPEQVGHGSVASADPAIRIDEVDSVANGVEGVSPLLCGGL